MKRNRRVSAIWFVIPLVVLAIYTAVTFVKQEEQMQMLQRATREMEQKLADEKQTNLTLSEQYEDIGSDESMERIAREKLGMVKDGERVFVDVNK